MGESWAGTLVNLLMFALYWLVLPGVASVLMVGAFAYAIVWLWVAVNWLLRGQRACWFAFGITVIATSTGVALGWFLYYQYLIPIASQVGR